MIFEVPIIW